VEKENFIEVLRHYSESSEEEALSVLSLRESYPYSQLLHTLAARVSKDHDFINHQKELQLAAVYASDRSVLKDIMTLDNLLDRRPHSSGKSDVENVAVVSPSQPVVIKAVSDGSYNVADEVLSDLEKLHELKHNFEQMFVDSVQVPKVIPVTSEKKEPVDNTVAKDEAPSEEPKQKGKKKNPSESFIEEIATTKQALEPENEKQKEQLQIIEQFIKTQPSIPNPKDKATATPAGDLSSIKTGEFNDNVVSETLVEILIKQGKKDKAIEVLKKLIWKFPQKKAYFAAQIEQLKSS
jgi:tetratricopeptide (TPR) repeat protein